MKHITKPLRLLAARSLFVVGLVVGLALSTLLTLLAYSTTAHAAGIQPMTLKYQVKIDGTEIGFINTDIKNDGNGGMISTSITEANPIFKALGLAPDVTEKVWFQTANSEYKPTKYFEKRTGRKAYESNVVIDWSAGKLHFVGGKPMPIPANDVLQFGIIPLAMIMRPASDFSGQKIKVFTKQQIREFKIGTPTPAKIETAMGTVHTIRIPAQRLDKPDRKLSIWLAPEQGNIPVRIENVRKKRVTVLSLVEINGKESFTGI
ncbi:MAG: DUF3108 domain-containing protein [Arenicellales bacterium WSBS_2016_MAG_OTU3]